MPPSTGSVKDFDLTFLKENCFVLRFPTVYSPTKIPPYVHQQNMFDAYKEIRDLAKIMNVTNSVELNKVVTTGKVSDLIRIEEAMKNAKLLSVARNISAKRTVKIVLVAGPSSSGKTTSSRKLCMYLQSFGVTPKVISMDDYFVERNQTPLDEDGKPDYECLEAMDVKLFDKQMAALLRGEKVIVPTYNFAAGVKEFKQEMQFAVKFAPYINERNVIGIMEELSLAQRDIAQNANAKIVFFDFALKMIVLIKNR
jgi:uridine kinase